MGVETKVMGMTSVDCQCCFCGLGIELKRPDPCELILATNFGSDEALRQRQGLFCHAVCLSQRMQASIAFSVIDREED
ncbi:MAG: hypothetical protein HKL90_13750 [Elusimicrobia bacterium]|nr:hypothetical protein [Elusimicrobiota bacterium]